MATSKINESDEGISYSYGVNDYITKPYNPTILLSKINALMKKCEMNKITLNCKEFEFDIGKGWIKNNEKEVNYE